MGSASLPELGFIPKTPLPGQRRRSVSDAVLAVSLTECFFSPLTRPAVNPGVGTGLPHSILASGFPASNLASNAKEMGKIKLFPTTEYSSKQSSDPVVPLVPCTGIFLGPSKSGKTVALISLILEQYRGVFERIYVFSPSVNIDDGWIPVKKYIEGDLGVNTEREQTYWDEWDEAALRRIIQKQRKMTEASKKLEMKKLYQVLVVIDDFADTPQLHKPHGALDTLFIRGRHMQISTWVSSQKLRLISAAVRVNMQFLCCWRLRNQHELDAVIEELSALLPKEQLCRLYEQATREPYSFLFVYYLKPRNETSALKSVLHLNKTPMGAALSFLGQKLFASSTLINAKCENISCCTSVAAVHPPVVRRTGGFLKKRMTTIYVDSRKRVAGSDSNFEVDLGESLHLQSDARLAVYKIRLADSFLSTDRGRYLYWVDAALGTLNWALLPEGAYTGARLAAWISSNFATATYSETTNSLIFLSHARLGALSHRSRERLNNHRE